MKDDLLLIGVPVTIILLFIMFPQPVYETSPIEIVEKKEAEPEPMVVLTDEEMARGLVESVHDREYKLLLKNYSEDRESKTLTLSLNALNNYSTYYNKAFIWRDSKNIARVFKKSNINLEELKIVWYFSDFDAEGNPFDFEVVRVDLSRDTLDSTNFDNLEYEELPDVANEYWEHEILSY